MRESLTVVMLLPLLCLAAAAALLLEPGERRTSQATLDCVTGEAAENPTQAMSDGRVLSVPRTEGFLTFAEARRFACVDAFEPEFIGDWELRAYVGRRTASLGDGGRRTVEISYTIRDEKQSLIASLVLFISNRMPQFDDKVQVPGPNIEELIVMGEPATLRNRDGAGEFDITWNQAELNFAVIGGLSESMSIEEDVLPVLESMD